MNLEEIKQILPHREPMLLVDEVELRDGTAFGKKKITGEEWFLKGHFPNNPVVPGVILCEILAQSACIFLAEEADTFSAPLFTSLDRVKFRQSVRPGDLFETECRITRSKGPFRFGEGKGFVGGKLCVSAEFSFALMGG